MIAGLAWLVELDPDDRSEAIAELRDAIASAWSSEDPEPVRQTLHAWATTVAVMRDTLRRAIHTGTFTDDDFVEAVQPQSTDG